MSQPKRRGHQLGQLINLEVPVSVRLCEKLVPLEEVVALSPGTLLEFPQHHEHPLSLYLNESRVGHGYAADLEDSIGFVVESIDPTAREECLRSAP